ncbi:MAG: protein kinase [Deltaproteobacteria bacterium]|nr:protein kinase [Deltaproteobacteria bacterium]
MAGKVKLVVLAGPFVGRELTFDQADTFIFGRAEDCHLPLPPDDTSASRYHFLLEAAPPVARIRDLGSLNGTFVNGKKCGGRDATESLDQARKRRFPEVDLSNGDRIVVGDTMFECGIEGAIAPTVLMQPAPGIPETILRSPAPGTPVARTPEARGDLSAYELVRSIAKGGMAEVSLVRRRADGVELALKTILPEHAFDASMRALFLREVEVMRELRHPGIVALLDFGETAGTFWYVMELCRGGDVEEYAQARGSLDLGEIHRIMCQALEGLAFAHSQPKQFVHRDLKPSNLLLATPGGPVKIGDFGIAKSFQQAGLSGLTMTGSFAGTYDFMPREQLIDFKRTRPVSDVWSMAATYYFLATGALPREVAIGQDPIGAILTVPITPIRTRAQRIPVALAVVLDRALSDDARQRPQDGGAFLAELRAVQVT